MPYDRGCNLKRRVAGGLAVNFPAPLALMHFSRAYKPPVIPASLVQNRSRTAQTGMPANSGESNARGKGAIRSDLAVNPGAFGLGTSKIRLAVA